MSSLTRRGGGEGNPFRPIFPSAGMGLTPRAEEFFREHIENARTSHGMSMAGDSTVSWEQMTLTGANPLFSAGSTGRFWHPIYGIIHGRYVQFVDQAEGLPLGAPQGLKTDGDSWQVTNRLAASDPFLIAGVTAAFENPASGAWGWLITSGVNFHDMQSVNPLGQFQRFVWIGDGLIGNGVGRVLGSSSAKQGTNLAPGGSLLVELGWDSEATIRQIAGLAAQDLEGELAILQNQVLSLTGKVDGNTVAFEQLNREVVSLRTGTYQAFDRVSMQLTGVRTQIGTVDSTLREMIVTSEMAQASRIDELSATYITYDSARALVDQRASMISAARISEESLVRASEDESLAVRISFLEATGTGVTPEDVEFIVNARVAIEEAARIGADGALATRLDTVEANYVTTGEVTTEVNAAVAVEAAARASADGALATRATTLEAQMDGTTASGLAVLINNESIARVDGDNAIASNVTTLSTTVGGLTTTVTQHTSSINGIEGRWGVTVNVNGQVTGVQLLNGTGGSTFDVVADRFRVIAPGATAKTIFEVTPTYVRFTGRLVADDLMGGVLDRGDLQVGSARIVFDNGSVMRVQGTGFGTSNQFVDWFGPRTAGGAINLCAESNATFYLRTDGAAYFGGSLTAGTLTTRANTSSLSASAEATTAVFGSNGGLITVVFSWSYQSGLLTNYPATSPGLTAFNGRVSAYSATSDDGEYYNGSLAIGGTATIELWRSIGGGVSTLADTLNVSGGMAYFTGFKPIVGDHAGWGQETYVYQASRTFYDPSMSVSNRQYRVALIGRSISTLASDNSQRLGLVAVE